MKITLPITCIAILMLCSQVYSQSNLTWTLKDKGEKGFFKTHTEFNSNFSGFSNKNESSTFIEKVKSNPEIASVNVSNIDANGNCDVVLNMKQPHDKMYYIGLAQKFGITYIQYNNQKKTLPEITQEIRNKNK